MILKANLLGLALLTVQELEIRLKLKFEAIKNEVDAEEWSIPQSVDA